MKPVMLALSTFRYTQKAIHLAFEKARAGRPLVIVYVVDENLARYYFGLDPGSIGELQETCEADLLKEHEKKGAQRVAELAARAQTEGIPVKTYVATGRFALKYLAIIPAEDREIVITTRTKRPDWVRKFFGSPVDQLAAQAGRPVIVV